jgi:hypothetical protein
MATVIETNLRLALTEFVDTYNKALPVSLYGRVLEEINADTGFFKPAALSVPGEMELFNGTLNVKNVESAAQIYETKVFAMGVGIDKNLLGKTDSISKGQVSKIIRGTVSKAIGHLDRRLTALMLTGESVGNLVSGAFYSATGTMPGAAATYDNIVGTSVSGSAAEVRAAIRAAQAHFVSMRNAGNDLQNGEAPRIGVMFDPRRTNGIPIYQSVADAINPDILNDAAKFAPGSVVAMPNGYLSGSIDDLWFFDLDALSKTFIVGWEQKPLLETINPNDSHSLIFRKFLVSLSQAYEVSWGSPFSSVLGNDA